MHATKSYARAGVAMMGAGVIVATSAMNPAVDLAKDQRSAQVRLAAVVDAAHLAQTQAVGQALRAFDPVAALQAFVQGTLLAFERPGPVPYTPVGDPVDGVAHVGEGVAATGLRAGAAVVSLAGGVGALFQAALAGDGAAALEAFVTNVVDGPLWVVDPTLYALRDALPAPLGGAGGFIETVRDQIWRAAQEVSGGLLDPAGVVRDFVDGTLLAFQRPGPVPYTAPTGPLNGVALVAQGAVASGMRLAMATVTLPLGFVDVLPQIVAGNGAQALSAFLENVVDGSLWIADPALYGLRDALPAPFGGPGALVENLRNAVWAATEQINAAIGQILGVAPAAAASSAAMAGGASEASDAAAIAAVPAARARLVAIGTGTSTVDDTGSVAVQAPEAEEPAAAQAEDQPAVEKPQEQSAVEKPKDEPTAEKPKDEPPAEKSTEQPTAEKPKDEPKGGKSATDDVRTADRSGVKSAKPSSEPVKPVKPATPAKSTDDKQADTDSSSDGPSGGDA